MRYLHYFNEKAPKSNKENAGEAFIYRSMENRTHDIGKREVPALIVQHPGISTGRRLKAFFLINVMLLSFFHGKAQQSDYAVQANIIYHFTKYIDWPEDKKTGDFVIGIVGDSPLFDELKNSVSNKTVGGQRIVIKKFPGGAPSYNCHILFISEEASGSIKRIATVTANTSTLLVTELEGLAHKGSCINFIIVDDHLKLEINKTNIEKRNLNIATELLNLGIIVK